MVYKTKHLDFQNATIDEEGNLIISKFQTLPTTNSKYKYSGIPVNVNEGKVVDTKRYTKEYIDNALASCKANNAPRLQEWKDLRKCYNKLTK